MQRLGAREIRLLVSVDHGVRWQHAQSVRPEAGRFEFQANADGAIVSGLVCPGEPRTPYLPMRAIAIQAGI